MKMINDFDFSLPNAYKYHYTCRFCPHFLVSEETGEGKATVDDVLEAVLRLPDFRKG